MTTTKTIFQCGLCHRQHDGTGGLLAFRPCVPELRACGQVDCAECVSATLEREAVRRRARQARRNSFVAPPRPPLRSSCPPERDFEAAVFESPAEKSAFALAPEREKEALLEYPPLLELLHDFLGVKNFGQWFLNFDLVKMLETATGRRVNNFNNVMSKLRARYADEGLELDVDTEPLTAEKWRVRVCHKKESLRLLRENPSRRK